MLTVFLNVILPILVVAIIGSIIQRWRNLPIGPLSSTTVYVLSPALIFQQMLGAEVSAELVAQIIAAAVLTTIVLMIVSILFSTLMRQKREAQASFLLTTLFPNAANMALPICFLAFGDEALTVATILFVYHALMGWSLGVFIAARSGSQGFKPLIAVMKMPALYAAASALAIRSIGFELPFAVEESARLLAGAAIPMMLLVLGFQLGQGVEFSHWRILATSLILRLGFSSLIAFGVTEIMGLSGIAQKVIILVSSMPTAVFTTLLATEFNVAPRFVTNAVISSTIISLLSLTVLITVLERW